MIPKELRAAYRVQFESAGWSTPPGRAVCAIESARIWLRLQTAVDEGIASIQWVYDDDYQLGDIYGLSADQEAAKYESGEWTGPYGCIVTYRGVSASLWGITLNSRGIDDPYARTIEADLAFEVLPSQRVGLMRFERPALV